MRTPNKEQREAIESSGSVLLSAGAGSGKTYVLVEHIMFLVKNFVEHEGRLGTGDFSKRIRNYFSGIVLITFTRKSTAEIRLRVKKRMEEEVSGKDVWKSVLEALPLLTISTIHGFCSLLLRQGFFQGFGRSFEIMSEIERRKWIENLFAEWFEFEKKKGSFDSEEKNYETIIANVHSIINGLVKIFNDPALRNAWKKFQVDSMKNVGLDTFMKKYLFCTGLEKIFSEKITVEVGSKPKKWALFLNDFSELAKSRKEGSLEGLEAFEKLFSLYPRITAPKNTGENRNIIKHIEGIKQFKKFLKEYKDDLVAFEKHQGKMYQWIYLFNSAFEYVENNCRRNPKMSYSDLEYYVYEGLENKEVVDKISDVYQYIVIDEFQDTSHIQFEIARKIVKGNYKKLFCVGDNKQAIYGFRGGEIAVFEKCRGEVEKNLSLAFNYRSEKTIVEFNNRFFSALLDCGDSFENIESCKSERETFQQSAKNEDEGVVFRHKVIVSDHGFDIEKVEAQRIFDLVDSMRKSGKVSEVAVLYKKLAPSKFLMEHLLLNRIPFVAQVKIPYGEDFVVGLCMILLEFYLLFQEQKNSLEKIIDYPKFMILSYFNLMGLNEPKKLSYQLEKFLNDVNLYGFESAFCGFIYDLGISNSYHGQNIKIIKDLYGMFGEDLESIYSLLKKNSDQKYSMDVHFGENEKEKMKIVIMTVHSSKGLEFEHVILGGTHGTDKGTGEDNYIGKYPAAIKWKLGSEQKRPFRSPEFILEKHISSQKNFFESKRLFYVACTRAIKGLHWVDVEKKVNEKSWVVALRRWCDLSLLDGINFKEDCVTVEEGKCALSLGTDAWGVVERGGKRSSIVLPEVSVSGFVSITQCPRKFYLQNVCRFEKHTNKVSFERKASESENAPVSSVARGSALHGNISEMINREWKDFSGVGTDGEGEILHWVRESLSPFYDQGIKIFSEISVKFSFFGQVISGTADLVAFDKALGLLEVWDFKTGKRDDSYWFQLFCYGYGFARKYALEGNQTVNMAIVYLDKREIVRKAMSFSQIKKEVEREWAKTNDLSRTNREHCSSCSYQNLCRP